jgi:hypothetical protein
LPDKEAIKKQLNRSDVTGQERESAAPLPPRPPPRRPRCFFLSVSLDHHRLYRSRAVGRKQRKYGDAGLWPLTRAQVSTPFCEIGRARRFFSRDAFDDDNNARTIQKF